MPTSFLPAHASRAFARVRSSCSSIRTSIWQVLVPSSLSVIAVLLVVLMLCPTGCCAPIDAITIAGPAEVGAKVTSPALSREDRVHEHDLTPASEGAQRTC